MHIAHSWWQQAAAQRTKVIPSFVTTGNDFCRQQTFRSALLCTSAKDADAAMFVACQFFYTRVRSVRNRARQGDGDNQRIYFNLAAIGFANYSISTKWLDYDFCKCCVHMTSDLRWWMSLFSFTSRPLFTLEWISKNMRCRMPWQLPVASNFIRLRWWSPAE